ncbi:helix-turn-helix domain-containing protein [Sneathiella limimaris]|uniref:helix-turn-helix domain-containing protein n=1 Tax=Sneathiella limimaris TaxID=1964213 RepID=UPI00146D7C96|nr:helix-turn-helix domain-containing protein [Sneathiella limimaris]
MSKQGKLPLGEDKSRLKLAIPGNETDQEASISKKTEKENETPQAKLEVGQQSNMETAQSNTEAGTMDELSVTSEPSASDPLLGVEEEQQLTVGAHLRMERERQGLSLHEVAEKLRLRPSQLQALEDADYESLPGQTFVTGFIRSYATTLGLDAVSVVDLYKQENSIGQLKTDLAFPEPTPEGRLPGTGLLVGSILVAAALFGAWYFYLKDTSFELEVVEDIPDRLVEKFNEVTSSSEEPIVAQSDTTNTVSSDPAVEPAQQEAAPIVAKPEILESSETAKVEGSEMSSSANMGDTASSEAAAPTETTEPAEAAPGSATSAEETTVSVPQSAEAPAPAETTEAETQAETQTASDQPVAAASSAVESSSTAETVSEAAPQVEQQADNNSSAPVADTPEPTTETATAAEETTEQVAAVPDAAPVTTAPVTLGVENAEARLMLMVRQETWVQVKTAGGETLLDRIMNAGDTFMLPDESGLTLSSANAAGLELRLDGTPLGSLGGYGEIVRDLSLNPQNLREQFGSGSQ